MATKYRNRYSLTILPPWRAYRGEKGPNQPDPDLESLWSVVGGFENPPNVGDRVWAAGGFGLSTVVGYFEEYGFLGLWLRPDKRPQWHREQNPRRDTVHLFGAEVKPSEGF